ncbi:hypothetical protein FX988_02591 [Paraglaciecola mesophila]|uniref:DUF1488 domain-containing protein n=1 Tax=Paraglaciecola mesophila TaxID=197222 RepID=A0A857JP58_9ALTE|nr:hypothetical protein [Paraglaciecola mesophila]QHJ12334.1 hypothetical protein FX988_02591 [Paraglaciecola mesophila]
MNQAIQIQDGFEMRDDVMVLTLVVSGLIMYCHVSAIAADDMATFYQAHQFDLEEMISECVENEQWDENGVIHINANAIGA